MKTCEFIALKIEVFNFFLKNSFFIRNA